MTPDEFRKHAHELVEWMAGYMENVENLPRIHFPEVNSMSRIGGSQATTSELPTDTAVHREPNRRRCSATSACGGSSPTPACCEAASLSGILFTFGAGTAAETAQSKRQQEATRIAETQRIIRALKETRGNKSKASELLHVSYKTLLTKIRDYGIES